VTIELEDQHVLRSGRIGRSDDVDPLVSGKPKGLLPDAPEPPLELRLFAPLHKSGDHDRHRDIGVRVGV
jgi:hypothetical protein